MRKGLSLRFEWLEALSELDVSRFDLLEIIPSATESSLSESLTFELLNNISSSKASKWLHVVNVGLADDTDSFKRQLEFPLAVANDFEIEGISLHFSIEFIEGRKLPQPLPVSANPIYLKNALENCRHIQASFDRGIAVENISCGTRFGLDVEYLDSYETLLAESGVASLLDFSNLSNTTRNLGASFQATLDRVTRFPIAYAHLGGSLLIGNSWIDAHNGFDFTPEVLEVLDGSGFEFPVVYEQDYKLTDLEYCQEQIEAFCATLS